jgi:hypothetical protein
LTQPTLGRIVHYKLTEAEAKATTKRREDFRAYMRKNPGSTWDGFTLGPGDPGQTGHQAHWGSMVDEGDTFPAIVTYYDIQDNVVWINLQVFLDGNDSLYVIDPEFGDEPGQWSWPPRVDS